MTQYGHQPDNSARPREAPDCTGEAWHPPPGGGPLTWDKVQPPRPVPRERLLRLVSAIEAEIIPRLVKAHRGADAEVVAVVPVPPLASVEEVQAFARLSVGHDDLAVCATVDKLRRAGASVEVIYLELLAPAAQYLGWLWEEDLCNFADVTVGMGRLQQLMRGLSPAFGAEVEHPPCGRRVLLAPAPGEQHTFGLSMVGEFFIRDGWDVVSATGAPQGDVAECARAEWFDVVGLSLGSAVRLEALKTGIAEVRQVSRNRAVVVMVGGPLFGLHPEYVGQVGADGTSSDARTAPASAEALLGTCIRQRG